MKESGSNRDKKERTESQNKWANPFYTLGTRRKIAFIKKLKKAQKLIQRHRNTHPTNEMPLITEEKAK